MRCLRSSNESFHGVTVECAHRTNVAGNSTWSKAVDVLATKLPCAAQSAIERVGVQISDEFVDEFVVLSS